MSSLLTPQQSDLGWVIEIPADMAHAMGVAEGSLAVLHTKAGTIEVQVLPPPSLELRQSVRRIYDKFQEAFEEMKRLGD